MKFKRIIAFALLLTILPPQLVSAKDLSYWYSDSNRIGKVNNHYIFRINYSDGLSAVDFTKYTTYARDQWKMLVLTHMKALQNQMRPLIGMVDQLNS